MKVYLSGRMKKRKRFRCHMCHPMRVLLLDKMKTKLNLNQIRATSTSQTRAYLSDKIAHPTNPAAEDPSLQSQIVQLKILNNFKLRKSWIINREIIRVGSIQREYSNKRVLICRTRSTPTLVLVCWRERKNLKYRRIKWHRCWL